MGHVNNADLYDLFLCYRQCFLCDKPWGTADAEGNVEHPVITPCGHPFGSKCLKELAPCPDGFQGMPPGEYCPWCGMGLLYKSCKHIIRPRKAPLVKDEKGEYVIPAEAMHHAISENELPKYCSPCAIGRLRFHSVYSGLEKELSHFLHLLDEANEKVRKCQADMEAIKPSAAAEWQQFQESRKGW